MLVTQAEGPSLDKNACWGMIFTLIVSVVRRDFVDSSNPPQHLLTCVDLVMLGRVPAVLVLVWPGRGEAGGQQTGDQSRHQHPRSLLQPRTGTTQGDPRCRCVPIRDVNETSQSFTVCGEGARVPKVLISN